MDVLALTENTVTEYGIVLTVLAGIGTFVSLVTKWYLINIVKPRADKQNEFLDAQIRSISTISLKLESHDTQAHEYIEAARQSQAHNAKLLSHLIRLTTELKIQLDKGNCAAVSLALSYVMEALQRMAAPIEIDIDDLVTKAERALGRPSPREE